MGNCRQTDQFLSDQVAAGLSPDPVDKAHGEASCQAGDGGSERSQNLPEILSVHRFGLAFPLVSGICTVA